MAANVGRIRTAKSRIVFHKSPCEENIGGVNLRKAIGRGIPRIRTISMQSLAISKDL